MPRPRKLFLTNSLIYVTFRTEEGLPFVPEEYINMLIWSAMGKAQSLYPVEVCHFNFEANHAHLMIRVTDPELVPKFVGYLKQETAHAINRLLGRRRKTVWAEGYDSPTILDADKAIQMIAYTLLNPVKDNLVVSMDEYPGVSSWTMFKSGKFTHECIAISRNNIPQLENPKNSSFKREEIVTFLKTKNKRHVTFKLSPYSWKLCFNETKDLTDSEVHELLLARIQSDMEKIKEEHLMRNLSKPNPLNLLRQSILKPYTPKAFGKKMICLSSVVNLRKQFIAIYRVLQRTAQEVFLLWKKGEYHISFPLGLFPPCLPRRGNLLPIQFTCVSSGM